MLIVRQGAKGDINFQRGEMKEKQDFLFSKETFTKAREPQHYPYNFKLFD